MAARDNGNEFHAQQLARYCRICANLLRKKGSKTTVYKCKAKLDLLKQLGIDTDHDDNTIHPEHICNSCNTKLSHPGARASLILSFSGKHTPTLTAQCVSTSTQ